MSGQRVEYEGTSPHPGFAGSIGYLLLNLPLGIVWFTVLVTLVTVGVSTAVIWVGLPIAAAAVLLCRGGARLERARAHAMLNTYIAEPYRRLPEGGVGARWKARLREGATWRDLTYLMSLLPLGVLQFVLVTVFWATSLALAGMPIYYRFLPGGAYYFPDYTVRWITVDSVVAALPWAALGLLCAALSVGLTRALAGAHARFARALLAPSKSLRRKSEADGASFDTPFGPERVVAPAGGYDPDPATTPWKAPCTSET